MSHSTKSLYLDTFDGYCFPWTSSVRIDISKGLLRLAACFSSEKLSLSFSYVPTSLPLSLFLFLFNFIRRIIRSRERAPRGEIVLEKAEWLNVPRYSQLDFISFCSLRSTAENSPTCTQVNRSFFFFFFQLRGKIS